MELKTDSNTSGDSSIGIISYGMSYGWVSPVINELTKEDGEIRATKEQISWIAADIELGCLTTPLLASFLIDRFGRKWPMLCSAPILIASWVLTLLTRSVTALYFKRVLDGMGLGLITTIAPVYLAEIAEAKIRGAVLLSITVTWYAGILIQFCIGTFFSYDAASCINLVLPIIYILLFSFLPESPYYLMMKGQDDKAAISLAWFRGVHPNQVSEELKYIAEYLEKDAQSKESWTAVFNNKIYRRCLTIMTVIVLATIMTGLTTIFSYATELFADTSSGGFLNPDTCSLIIAAVFFVIAIPICFLIDKVGRRPLVILSGIGCFLSHSLSALYSYYKDDIEYKWIPFVTIGCYCLFVSIGLVPVMLAFQGELFPSSIKCFASGMTTMLITLTSLVTLKLYYIIGITFGMYVNYLLYATVVGLATCWLYFYVPETKNKTFNELYQDFERLYIKDKVNHIEELQKLRTKI